MADVLGTNDARAALNRIAAGFEAGDREPVFFGPHRRPVGVIVSVDSYTEMLDQIDDLVIAREVQDRLANDDGTRLGFDELAEAVGFDPATFVAS